MGHAMVVVSHCVLDPLQWSVRMQWKQTYVLKKKMSDEHDEEEEESEDEDYEDDHRVHVCLMSMIFFNLLTLLKLAYVNIWQCFVL